jgi:1,4-dihydroxy-6-naphthoate synthase
MTNKLTLGFSPCPNDCFIFDALIHHKIDTEGLSFDVIMEDVETLNQMAFRGELDITKLSFHAFAYCLDNYKLLNAGSALGEGCGPLLIAKKNVSVSEINASLIAIPGKYTTANFLFSLAFPEANNRVEMLFSTIEDAILNDSVKAGLIIHENRFTYQEKGLVKLLDLGEYWETMALAPIPLGGIAIKKTLQKKLQKKVDSLLRKSVEYAFANPEASKQFVKYHAQEMEDNVIKQHIDLYVNNFSMDLGIEGKRAVNLLFEKAKKQGIIDTFDEEIFVE